MGDGTFLRYLAVTVTVRVGHDQEIQHGIAAITQLVSLAWRDLEALPGSQDDVQAIDVEDSGACKYPEELA